MARFGLWIAALSLICLIALATSQNAPTNADNSSNGDITATCTKYFDVDSKMCVNSVINMIFKEYMKYFEMMNPDQVRRLMQDLDTDKDNLLNLTECQNFVQHIIRNAPNTNTK
ncbi:uncharacterized protein Hap1MRO34_005762 [Clarias gariepinus]